MPHLQSEYATLLQERAITGCTNIHPDLRTLTLDNAVHPRDADGRVVATSNNAKTYQFKHLFGQ
jgi:hypothetical protein